MTASGPHICWIVSTFRSIGLDDAVIWFGIIGMGATMTGIVANELARRGRATEERARTINWLTLLYGLLPASLPPPGVDAQLLGYAAGAVGDQPLPQHARAVGERVDCAKYAKRAAGDCHIAMGAGEFYRPGRGRAGPWLDWDGCGRPTALTVSSILLVPAQWLLALAWGDRTAVDGVERDGEEL